MSFKSRNKTTTLDIRDRKGSDDGTQTSSSIFNTMSLLTTSSYRIDLNFEENSEPFGNRDGLNVVLPSSSKRKHILSSFTSAHLRQFVSPFYKQPAVQSPFHRPPRVLKRTLRDDSAFEEALIQSSSRSMPVTPVSRQSVKLSLTSSQLKLQGSSRASSREGRSTSRDLHYNPHKKRKLSKAAQKKVVERLSTPTQSAILRTLKENPDYDRRKPAIEYTKRIYLCQKCKKRNEDL